MFGLRGFRLKTKIEPTQGLNNDNSDTNPTEKSSQSTKKTCWLLRLFKCCKKRNKVSSFTAATEEQKTSQEREATEERSEEKTPASFPRQDTDVPSVTEQLPDCSNRTESTVIEVLPQKQLQREATEERSVEKTPDSFPRQDTDVPSVTEELPNCSNLTESTVIEVLPQKQLQSSRPGSPKETNKQQKSSLCPPKDEIEPIVSQQGDSCSVPGQQRQQQKTRLLLQPECEDYYFLAEQALIEALIQAQVKGNVDNAPKTVRNSDGDKIGTSTTISSFGFPNIGMSCYMNSCLQSLLTLENFVRDISCQERVWSSVPEAQLLRSFIAVRDGRTAKYSDSRKRRLHSFKEAVSVQAPEFRDGQQKDAHEFLTTVLDQMRGLSPGLQHIAGRDGRRYTCPVENHLVFKLENTRTCRRCGTQSKRQEVFTNLSLDLVPGGSVEDMLQEYMKETELEYRCECGGKTSGQRLAFASLPRVLILHLKRFCFTPTYQMVKVHDPVKLDRDLVVSSKLSGGCYSLVSAVSHLGDCGESGHYISDGIHPDNCPDDPSDRWLTYNDQEVTETTGAAACEQRQESAYILVYKRHVWD